MYFYECSILIGGSFVILRRLENTTLPYFGYHTFNHCWNIMALSDFFPINLRSLPLQEGQYFLSHTKCEIYGKASIMMHLVTSRNK